jgi:Peptidase A4 family
MRCLIAVTGIAVAAILGLLAPASASAAGVPSPGWYGYAVTGSTYTSTTADWTMPSLACTTQGAYVAIWTGLDGYSSDTAEQVGAEAYCSGGTASYFGWYDLYPAAPVDFGSALKPGDRLQASVAYDGAQEFTLTLHDVTRGWSHTVNQSLAGTARSSAETVVQVPASLSCAPTQTLAAFTGDTVDGSPLGSLDPVKVTGSNPHISVSAVNGEEFSVTCDGSRLPD